MRLAEKSKQDKRGQINALRIKFQQLLRDNEALPPHLRLNKKEFVMCEERELETKQEIIAKVGGHVCVWMCTGVNMSVFMGTGEVLCF